MSPLPAVRLLQPADVPAAAAVGGASLSDQIPVALQPTTPAERAHLVRRQQARVSHLLATDPEGSWVAEVDGEIVGVALALVRDDIWGLSLFGVRPGLQGQGIGRLLLAAALGYAAGRRGALILSSTDPRAMRSYARAGFAVKPALAAAGAINRARLPAGLRTRAGDVEADRELLDAVSRHVRTAAHGRDLGAFVAAGDRLLVLDGRGFAVSRRGSPILLAAFDDEAATDLLWSCLADGAPGAPVHLDYVTQGNDWAVAVALEAGLSLSPDGPVFVRGETGPFAPYLPSGAYL
ncbi:MAG TPA: GNAT family N-acetyltransferase [Baekduia sp.]|uniref:GNAT family N-acetyltransferase n=1 Tax=Baekduia sp. TaxID=2600305 RepID=UPI002BE654B2|nr:GNAT family N-acetyltransferase [Baekduia sp.]HMJ37174.1 GNAT family N-acetyltransferase [Baekduia sp.]